MEQAIVEMTVPSHKCGGPVSISGKRKVLLASHGADGGSGR